jgi:N6-adenosine-specific RNA methylase IME4
MIRVAKYRTIVADPPWPYDDGFNGFGARRTLPYPAMPVDAIAALPIDEWAAPGAHLYLWTTNRYLPEALGMVEMWGFTYAATLVWCKPPGQKGLGGRFATTTEFVIHAATTTVAAPRRVERAGAILRAAREAAGLTRAEVFHRVRGGKKTGIVNNWELDICLPSEPDWRSLQALLPDLAGVERPEVPSPPPRERRAMFRHDSSWWEWPVAGHSRKPDAFLDMVEQVSRGPYLELFARRQRLGWDTWGDEALEHVEMEATR